MKVEDGQQQVIFRMAVSILSLVACGIALLWMQRQAAMMQEDREIHADPIRQAWMEQHREWVEESPETRALWSGTVSRFVAGASQELRAIEIEGGRCHLGFPGPRDSGSTVYIGLSRLVDERLPAFGEGTEWLLLVERDGEHRNQAVAATPF